MRDNFEHHPLLARDRAAFVVQEHCQLGRRLGEASPGHSRILLIRAQRVQRQMAMLRVEGPASLLGDEF